MGNAIGAGSYIAYEEETTEGVGVTPTAKHWVRQYDVNRSPSFDDVEPLGTSDDALPNSRALYVQSIESGGSFTVNAYYDTDFVLVVHKHAYGAVATAGTGPYTYTYTLTKDVPAKPSLTLEFVRGQDGPTESAEVYNGCRVSRYVRTMEAGGTVQIACDFIAQTADDRAAPTAGLSYPSTPNLAYHADVTAFVFNGVTFDDVLSATLTIDKRLERTPKLGSLTSGAPVREFGLHEERPWLAMEYLVGRTLRVELKRARRLSPDAAAQVLDGVLQGLGALHQAGLVHRDLKPGNVMVLQSAGDTPGGVKLMDFGLVRRAGLHPEEGLMGTPDYMAPEQLVGDSIGPHTDVYAAGMLAYKMVVGRLPFRGSIVERFVERVDHVVDELPDLHLLGRLEPVVRAALQPAGRRPSDAAALRQLLLETA